MSVLFSAVGQTDPIKGGRDAAILHIIRHYRPRKVYLFFTQEMGMVEKQYGIYEATYKLCDEDCEIIKKFTEIKDAHNFDAFHYEFDKILEEIISDNPDEEILLNASSGTPQIKTSMCLIGVMRDKPFKVIQVESPNSGANDARDFSDYDIKENYENCLDTIYPKENNRCSAPPLLVFKKSEITHQLKALAVGYEYKAAYELYCKNHTLYSNKKLEDILYHAYQRLMFEEKAAKEAVVSYDFCSILYPTYNADAIRVLDYFMVLLVKSKRKEYTDFVLTLKPFAEHLILQKLSTLPGTDEFIAERNIENSKRTRMVLVKESAPKALVEKLDNSYRGGFRTNEWGEGELNLETLIVILKYCLPEYRYIRALRNINELIQFRNAAAHDLSPVREEDIAKKAKSTENILSTLKKFIKEMSELSDEAFDILGSINKMIFKELDGQ